MNTALDTGVVFAFGFVQAAMLGWLAAASIPIVLHLWNRHRRRDVDWAAMRFLLAAIQRRSRLRRIEHWLLLALRTLLICAVVFAAARPYAESQRPVAAAGQPVHRIVAIDGSMSMDRTDDGRTAFSRAQQTATDLVEQFGDNDGVSLLLMADPPQVYFAQPSLEAALVVEQIGRLELTHRRASLADTLARCESVATQTRKTHPQLSGTDVYIVTDLAENDWGAERRTTELEELWQRLTKLAAIHIVDVGTDTATRNVAVTRLSAADPFIVVGQPSRFNVELTSYSDAPANVELTLNADGRTIATKPVTLAPGAPKTVDLSGSLSETGFGIVEARINADELEADNVARLVVAAEATVDVLCVDGNPGGSPLAGSCGYLAVALSPQDASRVGSANRPALVRPKIVGEGSWLEEDLSKYACVALCNVGQFTVAEAAALKGYLRRGGAVWFFLGDRAQLNNYNRVLISGVDDKDAAGESILPARLLDVAPAGSYTIDPLDYAHQIVEPFRGHGRAGLLTTPVERYVRIAPRSDAKTVLALENGDPLVVESDAFAGKSILVATSADDSWTAMPMLPSYVPLVQEMLRYSVARRTEQHNLRVGQPIQLPGVEAGGAVTVRTPSGQEVTFEDTPTDASDSENTNERRSAPRTFTDTTRGGVYRVITGDDDEPYAVNVDTSESALRKTSIDALTEALENAGGFDYITEGVHVNTAESLPGQSAPLQRFLLFAAFAFVLTESLTAWHLGRKGGGL